MPSTRRLWVAIAGATLLNLLLKATFSRPRPDVFPWLVPHAGQSSFPSGHAMTSTVAYLTIAYLVARLQPSAALRHLTLAFAALVIFSVGLSRVYLGVHYPSDVMAGWVAGVAWASVCALGLEVVRHFRAPASRGCRPWRRTWTPSGSASGAKGNSSAAAGHAVGDHHRHPVPVPGAGDVHLQVELARVQAHPGSRALS